jgi:hypothetical protein
LGFLAHFAVGFVVIGLFLKDAYRPYAEVYRPAEEIQKVFPIGMAATFVAVLVLAVMYAKGYEGKSGLAEGARFGLLVGVFSDCAFVFHNYVNLRIGLRLTLGQAAAYLVEWLVVGIVIGLVYKPRSATSGSRNSIKS